LEFEWDARTVIVRNFPELILRFLISPKCDIPLVFPRLRKRAQASALDLAFGFH
jgi:hypothetical protein